MWEFKIILKNKKFIYLWTSQILSQFAVNLMTYLVLIHIYERTNSTIASSFVWVAYGIPAILVGPIAAAAVDLYDRRKILMYSNIIQSISVLIYALLYKQFAYLSYGVVLAYSVMDQFYVPAESATLPNIVKTEDLPRANGLFFISQQAATILGFGFAGIFGEILGYGNAVIVGALLLALAFLSVSRLPKHKMKVVRGRSVEGGVWKFFVRIKEGYDFIRHRKTILYPFLFLMWLQVSLAILVVNLPAIGTEIVMTKASFTGPIVLIPGGLGALTATLFLPKLMSIFRKKRIIETALLGLTFTFIFISVLIPLLPFWPGRIVLVLAFGAIGVSYVSCVIPAVTFMQTNTPNEFLGRIFGNYWFLTSAATLLPVLFAATITEILGVHLLIVMLGGVAGSIYLYSRIYLDKSYMTIHGS